MLKTTHAAPKPAVPPQKQLAHDQAALAANVATQKKDDAAFKGAAQALPNERDVFVQAQKATDAQLGAQRVGLDKKIAADQQKISLAHLPSAKVISRELGTAKKTEARDNRSLKGVLTRRKADNQAIDTLEKADPTQKALFQQARTRIDHPLNVEAQGLRTQISADTKTVAVLLKEQKERARINGAKGGGGFKGTGTWHRGPGSLYGADSSHWVSNSEFQRSLQGAKWSAIGATDGTGYVDPTFKSRWAELGQRVKSGKMKLRIAYHFMEPGNGTAQAQHFLSTLGIHGKLQPGTRLGLDFEAAALSDPKALHDAAAYIHKVTGTWPVVYVQGSNMGEAQAAAPSAPVWEASWGAPVNRNVPFVQYQSGDHNGLGYDQDVFNGNLASLERFAGWSA